MIFLFPLIMIAAGFVILLILVEVDRRERRRNMGLPPSTNGLPPRSKSWRDDPGARWADPRYFHRYGRKP